jgi:hypothetical protein
VGGTRLAQLFSLREGTDGGGREWGQGEARMLGPPAAGKSPGRRIMSHAAHGGGENQNRIRSLHDGHERVVKESDLSASHT